MGKITTKHKKYFQFKTIISLANHSNVYMKYAIYSLGMSNIYTSLIRKVSIGSRNGFIKDIKTFLE